MEFCNLSQAERQAKQIALKALQTMRERIAKAGSIPQINVIPKGVKNEVIVHQTQQYGMTIGDTSKSGYMDQSDFDMQKDMSDGAPENEAEAEINTEVGVSGDLANDSRR